MQRLSRLQLSSRVSELGHDSWLQLEPFSRHFTWSSISSDRASRINLRLNRAAEIAAADNALSAGVSPAYPDKGVLRTGLRTRGQESRSTLSRKCLDIPEIVSLSGAIPPTG